MMPNPIKDLASFYDARYQERIGARYPFNNGKDAKILKDLRELYSDEDLHMFMTTFFQMEDGFIEESGYGLGVFRGCLPKVIQYVQQNGRLKARRGQAPAFPEWSCPHVEAHTSNFACQQATQLNKPRKVPA